MARRRSPGACGGFTLIELVTAFGILALATAVAVPAFLRLVQDDDLTAATRTVQTLFRLARDSAVAGGAPVTVVIDSVSGLVWLDVPPPLGEADWGTDPAESGSTAGSLGSGLRLGSERLLGGGRTSGTPAASGDDPGTSLALPGTVTLSVPAARARFTFEPSGQAFGDSLALDSPLGSRVVTLDRWTGDVVLH